MAQCSTKVGAFVVTKGCGGKDMAKGVRKQTNPFIRLPETRYCFIIALFETCDKQKHVNKVIKSIEIDSSMYV